MANNPTLKGVGSPLNYIGTNSPQPPNLIAKTVSPTSGVKNVDIRNFSLGDMWLNTASNIPFMLTNMNGQVPTWTQLATSASGAANFITDSGTATQVGGNLNVNGGDLINTTGSGSTVKVNLNRGTNGQIIVASTGAASAYAHLTSSGGTITITEGANTLNIDTAGGVLVTIKDDDGAMATPAAGIITFHDGNNIEIAAAGSGVTFSVVGTTQHAVQIGNASGSLTSLAVGTNGQVLIGSTGADPAFATMTSTGGTIVFTPGANSLNLETSGGTANSFATDSGTATPAAGVLTVHGGNNIATSGAGSTVTINVAGTTNHALQVGNASAALTSLAVGTTGQMVVGNSAANPSWITAGNNGQVIIGSTGAQPAFATLTSTGGTITYTTGANSLNLEAAAAAPKTSSFFVTGNATESNVTGTGAFYTLAGFNVTKFDLGSNFSGSSTFTAPVTGKYQFNFSILIGTLSGSANGCVFRLIVNGGAKYILNTSQGAWGASMDASNQFSNSFSCYVDLASSDTVNLQVKVDNMAGSTASVIYTGGGVNLRTFWSGYLVTT